MLLPASLLLLLVLATAVVDAGCQFPAGLQTNGSTAGGGAARDWVGRVRAQFTDVGVRVTVASNLIRVDAATDHAADLSYTLVCLQVYTDNWPNKSHIRPHRRRTRNI